MLSKLLIALSLAVVYMTCVSTPVSVHAFQHFSIGDRLERDYTKYYGVPITTKDAIGGGWSQMSDGCDPNLGIAWAQTSSGPTTDKPLVLYFTPAGQVAGAGTLYREGLLSKFPQSLKDYGYLQSVEGHDATFYLSVTFRSQDEVCSNNTSPHPLGDRLVINANTIAEEVPLTAAESVEAGWVKGSCFQGMGTHWFKDFTQNGTLTWTVEKLLPIVTMYNEEQGGDGNLQAFFFVSPIVQQSALPPNANQWEPIPLPTLLMCKNFCDAKCASFDTLAFSTFHIYVRDRSKANCNNGCTLGCCSGDNADSWVSKF